MLSITETIAVLQVASIRQSLTSIAGYNNIETIFRLLIQVEIVN
jgi:hypothetical protein